MLITDKVILKNYTRDKSLWLGIPSIEVTKGGRTFLTYYSGGAKEDIGNFSALIMSDDGINFSEPIAVCFKEAHRCFDPCIWLDPLGRLWYTWSVCPDDGVYGVICDNPDAENLVFSEEFFIGNNVMMNKPTVLSSGEWAFPMAVWNYGVSAISPEFDSKITPKGSFLYATCDNGKTFQKRGFADVKGRTFDEHMFLELSDGRIRVFVRQQNGIGAADSFDRGFTWNNDFPSGIESPGARFHIRRLPSGRVLLINHYDFDKRNNLTALLSEDDGKTFPYRLLLDERDGVSYPDATVTEEGKIYITYDRGRGSFCKSLDEALGCPREILTACITEEDIIKGALVSETGFLKRVAYKLTEYNGSTENLF